VAVSSLAGPDTGVLSKTQSSPAPVSAPHPEPPAASSASWLELMPVTWIPSVSSATSVVVFWLWLSEADVYLRQLVIWRPQHDRSVGDQAVSARDLRGSARARFFCKRIWNEDEQEMPRLPPIRLKQFFREVMIPASFPRCVADIFDQFQATDKTIEIAIR